MGFRYQKRINLGGGAGLDISKSGISSSVRTKYGSIGPRGFSIRTGIPGLTFRSGKSGEAALIMLAIAAVALAVLVAWNVLRLLIWGFQEGYHFLLRKNLERQMKKVEPPPHSNFGDEEQ